MKKLSDILFSMTTTVVLLLIFAAGIGYATFAENASGTPFAHAIVYDAKWFELLLVLLIVNLIGSVIRFKVINKSKFSILLFHLSFILILAGAGITRYFGSEGIMHLREGETSNEITSEKSSVRIVAEYKGQKIEKNVPATFSETESNEFSETVEIGGKKLRIETELFMPNAVETLQTDKDGTAGIELFVMNEHNEGQDLLLTAGESSESNDLRFAFADSSAKADVHFIAQDEQLYMKASTPVEKISMMDSNEAMLAAEILIPVEEKTLYRIGNLMLVLKTYLPHATKSVRQLSNERAKMAVMTQPKNALVFKLSEGNKTEKVNVLYAENEVSTTGTCQLDDVKISLEYGNLPQKLPFSITLQAFKLDRYPGSNSPSSYASEITVTDTEMKTVRPFRIYMNNILNYRGYRFFQSSYDEDEQGTILSVSRDYWGTLVTYVGYFFMLIGMLLTLFNKNSRFYTVIRLSKDIQNKRKAAQILLLVGVLVIGSDSLKATNSATRKEGHLKALSSLLIQDEALGRIEPISTYASDVIRKISKKTSYKDQSALEVFIAMCTNPSHWITEPVIKVAHEGLAKELGAVNGYVSFSQLVDMTQGTYLLEEKVNAIYQKDPSQRNQYEKELLNVDERLNILNSIFSSTLLTIFPDAKSPSGKWLNSASFATPEAASSCPHGMSNEPVCPMTGKAGKTGNLDETMNHMAGEDAEGTIHGKSKAGNTGEMMTAMSAAMTAAEDSSPEQLLNDYLTAVQIGFDSDNWSAANTALLSIKNYQQLNGGIQLPSKKRVQLEVLYNRMSIFLTLAILYGFIGFLLVGLHLLNILKFNSKTDKFLDKSIYPLGIMFLFFTAGLALRWYISGHAPWSNGYESMIFVGWATALAGLVFAGRSPITLALTSLLAAIALGVAGMSWMNPEITNLVPVLKSYWLVVHVAVITSSYGFLATGAILGFFNLCLMLFRNKNNAVRLNETIQEFTYIIELAFTIGLFMLTVGTFLGGIWANESWGRYWGWDAKETWALVSILVYSVILHLRSMPKLNSLYLFNTLSLLGFSSVIMTYLGVNYYLSGMHSYGQGTPPPLPTSLFIALIAILLVIIGAGFSEKKWKIKKTIESEIVEK